MAAAGFSFGTFDHPDKSGRAIRSDHAERLAATAFDRWRASLARLWRDNGADPVRFPMNHAEAKARGLALAGTAG